MNNVTIYIDGACSGNPGPGGWGALFLYGARKDEKYGYDLSTTNNRMEIMAAIEALAALSSPHQVTIYTDSKYLQQGINLWIDKWIKNDWRLANNKPVKNVDLWKNLLDLTKNHQIKWCWVKGHSSSEGNRVADSLACYGRDIALKNTKKVK